MNEYFHKFSNGLVVRYAVIDAVEPPHGTETDEFLILVSGEWVTVAHCDNNKAVEEFASLMDGLENYYSLEEL